MQGAILIPARGGSRAIPRKNLIEVGGKPLLLRAIERARKALPEVPAWVSSDDSEILSCARLWGAHVVRLSDRAYTNEATIEDHVRAFVEEDGHVGSRICVLQPTSPFLDARFVTQCWDHLDSDRDACMTFTQDHRIRWDLKGKSDERVNRQKMKTKLVETGGCLVTEFRGGTFLPRQPSRMGLVEVDSYNAVDINTIHDLAYAESMYRPAVPVVRFVVSVEGTGHVNRCLTLAAELPDCWCEFSPGGGVDREWPPPDWATKLLESRGYRWSTGSDSAADVLVCDSLNDVTETQIKHAQAFGSRVIVLEHYGEASKYADEVVNELLDGPAWAKCGPDWAVLRPEFRHLGRVDSGTERPRVLLAFGGLDEHQWAVRLVRGFQESFWIHKAIPGGFDLAVLEGPGVPELRDDYGVVNRPTIFRGGDVAEIMLRSDLIICSAGRTVYEAVACRRPVIAVPVNAREATHVHCPGVTYAPPTVRTVLDLAEEMLASPKRRQDAVDTASAALDRRGHARLANLIRDHAFRRR